MKRLFLVAVIALMSSAQMFAIGITIKIDFGHHDETGMCKDRGLCSITVGGSNAIVAEINDNTGALELTFNKSLSARGAYDSQFINGIFEVPVAYSLSPDVCAKLGVDRFTVKTGRYKIIETAKEYKIVFAK